MAQMIKGKRYWFHNADIIYSGLFTGEYTNKGNAIICRRNGDLWSIDPDNLYGSKSEILKDYKNCKFKYIEN